MHTSLSANRSETGGLSHIINIIIAILLIMYMLKSFIAFSQDLKEKEMAELKLLESLKDREKRLTFELENKM